eukprot:3697564-Prymnesium_polylepis.2
MCPAPGRDPPCGRRGGAVRARRRAARWLVACGGCNRQHHEPCAHIMPAGAARLDGAPAASSQRSLGTCQNGVALAVSARVAH